MPTKRSQHFPARTSKSVYVDFEGEFEILADDSDDAKVRVKQLLADEGYDEKLLHRATWAVTKLDRQQRKTC